jgi:hypothetical protein
MPYVIKKSDGTTLLTLADGLIDSASSSLTLVGKNVSNYGLIQNENFLYLVENFANNTPPTNALRGQAWFDIQNLVLKINNGEDWKPTAFLDFSNTQPTASAPGYLWFDTVRQQLFINSSISGTDYTLIGPETIAGFDVTKLVSKSILGTDNQHHPIIEIVVNGEVLGVISNAEFFVDSSNPISGINQVYRGITAKNYTTKDFPFIGRSTTSDFAYTASTSTNLAGGLRGSIPYQTTNGATTFVDMPAEGYVLSSGPDQQPQWINLGVIQGAIGVSSIVKIGTSGVGDIGQTDNRFGTIYGKATSAQYADLAEKYLADQEYEVGTVVMIGGEKEITAATIGARALGVTSENPAYMMNSELEGGTYVALKGRVPVKVSGEVSKGDRLMAGNDGYAIAVPSPCTEVFAIALETNANSGQKTIEAVIL